MEEAEFESLRDALSPDREATSRLGAFYMALESRTEDDRIDSLVSTLLQDRESEFAASAAALVWDDSKLREDFRRELERVWAQNRKGYRMALLDALAGHGMNELAERYSRLPDADLRLRFVERSAEFDAEWAFDALLLLTHDEEAEVVCLALKSLAEFDRPARNAVLSRLIKDERPEVLALALNLGLVHLDHLELSERLSELESSESLDARILAAQALETLRSQGNKALAQKAIEGLQAAVDSDDRSAVELAAAELARVVPRHPEAEYQLARIAARDGDARRALVTLHHLIQLGQEWRVRAKKEQDFLSLHAIEAWKELIGSEQYYG